MALGNSYPAELLQQNGGTLDGIVGIQFTDSGDQPGSGGGGGGPIQLAQVVITSAQILALFDTPATIVAAPGSGKIIVPLYLSSSMAGYTTGYTIASNVAAGPPGNGPNMVAVTQVLPGDGTNPVWGIDTVASYYFSDGPEFDSSDYNNQPFSLFTSDANPTGGDGDLKLSLMYYVQDVTA